MNELLIHLILGPSLLVVAILFKAFQPKNINVLYGYRTRRSMKSEHTWKVANEMSANLMMWGAILTTGFQAVFYYLLPTQAAILASCGFLTLVLVAQIPYVEKHLKENYDEMGNPL